MSILILRNFQTDNALEKMHRTWRKSIEKSQIPSQDKK